MYSEELKSYLEAKPEIEAAYVNEKGDWLFHEREGYQKVLREEILGKVIEVIVDKVLEPVADAVVDAAEVVIDKVEDAVNSVVDKVEEVAEKVFRKKKH